MLSTHFFDDASDLREIGLMAAASPEFLERFIAAFRGADADPVAVVAESDSAQAAVAPDVA
jgi:hypothetical protein